MGISISPAFFLSRHLAAGGKANESTAIDASAQNIGADVYSAAGVLVGLLAVSLTKWEILDRLSRCIMVVFVLKAGYSVVVELSAS